MRIQVSYLTVPATKLRSTRPSILSRTKESDPKIRAEPKTVLQKTSKKLSMQKISRTRMNIFYDKITPGAINSVDFVSLRPSTGTTN
jgi:hypothetical protein